MALTTVIASNISVESAFSYGGTMSKKRVRRMLVINDALATSGGIVVGANTGDIPAAALGFRFVESCGNLCVFTTSTGAPVRVYLAAPSKDGLSIVLTATAGALSDVTIATTESARIEVVGY